MENDRLKRTMNSTQDRAAGGLLARLAALPPGIWREVYRGHGLPAEIEADCKLADAIKLCIFTRLIGEMNEDGIPRIVALRLATSAAKAPVN